MFSYVFWGYRKRPVAWNGLSTFIFFMWITCLQFFTYIHCFKACTLIACFRFSYVSSYFLRTFNFVKCFKFFLYLTCLHSFTCLSLIQFSNKQGNWVFIDFFIFPTFTRVLLGLKKLLFWNHICPSGWRTNSYIKTFFLAFARNFKTSILKTSVL